MMPAAFTSHCNRNFVPSQPMLALLRTVSAARGDHLFNLHPRPLIERAHKAGWIEPHREGWALTESGIIAMEFPQ